MQDEETKRNREGWSVQELADEASQQSIDEIQRQTLRGDVTKGDADEGDVAGNVNSNETSQGREEAKNNIGDKANANG
jgi:hypothetical protein